MATIEHALDLSAFTATRGDADFHEAGKDAKGNPHPDYLTGTGSFGYCLISAPLTVSAGDEINATFTGTGTLRRGNVFLVLGDDVTTGDSGPTIPPNVTAPTLLLDSASTGMSGTTTLTTTIPEGHDDSTPLYAGTWAGSADAFHLAAATVTLPEVTEPDPDPGDGEDPGDGDGEDPIMEDLATVLAPRVAKYVGRSGDADVIVTAEGQIPVVAEFVRGYTRGHGWGLGLDPGDPLGSGMPESPLRAAIVSACGRLVLNPEQVRQYTAADYSETPAILLGFTLAERHVLDRYRKRWA